LLVGDWLIHEPPWVELTILWPLIRLDSFLRWENFHSHIASFGKESALVFDISVWPSEKLNDGTLLSILVVVSLLDLWELPEKILLLHSDGILLAVRVNCLDN